MHALVEWSFSTSVVVPLCGGNIDTAILGRCLERGLAADSRLIKCRVTLNDRPGGLQKLTEIVANVGARLIDPIINNINVGFVVII